MRVVDADDHVQGIPPLLVSAAQRIEGRSRNLIMIAYPLRALRQRVCGRGGTTEFRQELIDDS
jgi:hypothetical protein